MSSKELGPEADNAQTELNFDLNQRLGEPLVRVSDFYILCVKLLVFFKVTIRPSSGTTEGLDDLRACLKQLTVLDSAVRVIEQEDGDLAIITAGEVSIEFILHLKIE